jgi:hypothetical protein
MNMNEKSENKFISVNTSLMKQNIMLRKTIADVEKKLEAIQRENDIIKGKSYETFSNE